jgi:DNA-binding NtrC family response regulator
MAHTALDRRMKMGAPVVVVAPASVDPVPHLARAHLEGPRPSTPFVVVDGTASTEREEARWRDPLASPLALAQGGLLVLADGAALPRAVQRVVAQALAERRLPWESAEPLNVVVALTSVVPPVELLRGDRLDPALLARLAEACESPIFLPHLQERAEDLRAIVLDRLAREGLRQRGAPVGIDDAAFARLADYRFPGDHAELATIAQRLVARVLGDVVRLADVDALGLVPADAPRVNVRASHSVS